MGLHKADDAAVYRFADDLAVVATTDFFTPVVDDPYDFGAIAAANSLSDVYAMGGQPLFALNVAGFPGKLPTEVAAEILRGGAEKAREAGCIIAGGHTVQDAEPKYGLVAIGRVHPDRMLTKGGARVGDALVHTKPLGTGVLTTAFMRDKCAPEALAAATASMKVLNRRASEVALRAGVRAATDVTGFGLLGHGSEMAAATEGVGLRLRYDALPLLPDAALHGEDWVYPGGAHANRAYFGPQCRFDERFAEWQQLLCFSPETSGGLLMAVPPERLDFVLGELGSAALIGEAVSGEGIEIV